MPGDPALGVRQTWACGSAPDGCVTVDKTTSEPDVAHLPTRTLSGVWGRIKGDNISLKETICKKRFCLRLLPFLQLHEASISSQVTCDWQI